MPRWLLTAVDLWFDWLASERRVLPLTGGSGEQPAGLMECFRMLDALRAARLADGE